MTCGMLLLIALVTEITSMAYSEEKQNSFIPCKGYGNHQHPTTTIHAMYLSAFARKDFFSRSSHPLPGTSAVAHCHLLLWTHTTKSSLHIPSRLPAKLYLLHLGHPASSLLSLPSPRQCPSLNWTSSELFFAPTEIKLADLQQRERNPSKELHYHRCSLCSTSL